jgi:integrase
LGKRPLAKLTPQDIRAFMTEKLKDGLSPKTVKHLRDTLRNALNVAVKDGLIVRNAAALADPPRAERHEMKAFTPTQARQFLDEIRGHRLEALFSVALSLGLRQGEVLGLRWQDVDLEKRTLAVRFQLQRIESKLQLVEPKTARSARTLMLPAVAVSALAAHKSRQDTERLVAGTRWIETGMVFTTSIGTMLDARSLLKAFYKIMTTSDLPRVRFHDLRHSAATLLLAQGVHPRVVMDLLGHSSIAVTLDTYSHVIPDMQRESASQMDAVLNPVASTVASSTPPEDAWKRPN